MKSKSTHGSPIPVLTAQPKPIFVVGMNGSGTSMLADCLGQHPELFAAYFETKVFPYLLLRIHKYGDLSKDDNFFKLWMAVLNIPVMTQINGWAPPQLPSNWQAFPRTLPAIIDAVFRSIALKYNKQRWAEKTPQYIQHLELLSKSFPEAKFIHIVRDGRDCAASFHRRWRRSPEYTMTRWKRDLQEGSLQSRSLEDKYFELSYEDMTTHPEKWLRQVCDFVDLPFNEVVLRSNQPHREGVEKSISGLIQPNSGKWKSYFDKKQITALEKIAGAKLSAYGYETMYEQGDKDPNLILMFYWKWKDRLRELYDLSWGNLTGKTQKVPWSRIAGRVVTSIKQSRANRF